LHDAAHDDVFDELGIEVVALHERLQHLSGQVGRMPTRELPVALAAGGADGVDDDCGGHGLLLLFPRLTLAGRAWLWTSGLGAVPGCASPRWIFDDLQN